MTFLLLVLLYPKVNFTRRNFGKRDAVGECAHTNLPTMVGLDSFTPRNLTGTEGGSSLSSVRDGNC